MWDSSYVSTGVYDQSVNDTLGGDRAEMVVEGLQHSSRCCGLVRRSVGLSILDGIAIYHWKGVIARCINHVAIGCILHLSSTIGLVGKVVSDVT